MATLDVPKIDLLVISPLSLSDRISLRSTWHDSSFSSNCGTIWKGEFWQPIRMINIPVTFRKADDYKNKRAASKRHPEDKVMLAIRISVQKEIINYPPSLSIFMKTPYHINIRLVVCASLGW